MSINRRDILFEQGKERAAERMQKYRYTYGNEIGRKELCPCGNEKMLWQQFLISVIEDITILFRKNENDCLL